MSAPRATLCRAAFLLPLAEPDRGLRIPDGYVLAEGETLREVGAYTPAVGRRLREAYGPALRVLGEPRPGEDVPCPRAVLMPAFVKAHGHDHEQPLIGIAKDQPLTAWLDHAVNPFTRFLNRERERLERELGDSPHAITYRLARVCDIHYGITTSLVHHCNFNKYHFEDIARVNEAAGTTMIVALGSQDRHYVPEALDRPQDALERLRAAAALPGLERTRFCPGPDQFFSNSREMLVPLKAWAREHGTLFHIHSAEEPRTTRWFTEEVEPGLSEVEFAESLGLLDENTVLAHQVNCGPRDVEILARTGARVVHNPLANTILGSGMPPVLDMIRAGVPVAISTDGSGSADNQNILAAARLAAQYQRALHQDATLLGSQQLLERITCVPAQILKKNQGELAPGRQADWILVSLDRPNLTPTRLDNVVENLIWAADGSEVDTVVARGRVLKQAGRVLPFSDGSAPEAVLAAAQRLSELFAEYLRTAPELTGTGAHR
ncbi:MAG TPA: amidohydrolase family protein [Candidatus Saccharimonadales bacterium]|nr:amidohydrolase family protein [Candidatus Saccharimonadales bacterium]